MILGSTFSEEIWILVPYSDNNAAWARAGVIVDIDWMLGWINLSCRKIPRRSFQIAMCYVELDGWLPLKYMASFPYEIWVSKVRNRY